MAKTYEVDLNVQTNIEPTIANLKALKRQLKETAAGSEEFNRLQKQIRELDDAISDAAKTSDDFLGYLENASGPLGLLGQGIRSAERTFSSFNAVLKASVIGALVGIIGGLAKAISQSDDATKKFAKLFTGLEKIFNGVYRAIEPLFNTFIDLAISALPIVSKAFEKVYASVTAVLQSFGYLGDAIGKLIKGDFSGAWDDAKKSVTKFSDNFDSAVQRFTAGSKEMTKSQKEEAKKRAEERQKELDDELAALTAANDKIRQADKEAMEKRFKELTENREYLKSQQTTFEKDKAKIDEKFAQQRINLIKTENKTKEDLAAQYVESSMRIGQGLRQLAGDNKELAIAGIILEQSAAVASIAINTQKNAAKYGYLTPMGIAELIAGAAGVASAIAAASKGIQDINSGTASASQMSFGNPQMVSTYSTAPVFNVVGVSPINQAAQAMATSANQPVKAYVVSKDITTAQELDRNKIATIGL